MFIFAGTSNTQKQRHVVLPVRSKTGLIIFLVCLDKKANKNVKQDCHLFPLCVLPSRVLFWQNDIWVFATTSFPTREICAQHQFCVLIIISVLDPRGRGLDDSDRSWAQRLRHHLHCTSWCRYNIARFTVSPPPSSLSIALHTSVNMPPVAVLFLKSRGCVSTRTVGKVQDESPHLLINVSDCFED